MTKITRQCKKCKNVYPKTQEYFNKSFEKYLRRICKKCDNKRRRKYPSYATKEAIKRKDDKARDKLTDSYIKKTLRMPNASQEIIDLKRLHIKLKRELKSWKST